MTGESAVVLAMRQLAAEAALFPARRSRAARLAAVRERREARRSADDEPEPPPA
jgi:hypothetical protein